MNNLTTSLWLVHPLCATVLFFVIASSTLSGCTARVQPATVAVVAEDDLVVDAAPVNVYAYPHTEYRGTVVYYVNGRWYRPHGNRWYYYRSEPPALARQRQYVQQAPPARRGYDRHPHDRHPHDRHPYGGGPRN
jgi:hypothetical protein